MASITNTLREFFARQGTKPVYWLGFSGGVDSQVLVHACYQLQTTIALKFHIIHVNHGISPSALQWQAQCQAIAKHYQIPFSTVALRKGLIAKNVEAELRKARYHVFANEMQAGDILLTAHHQDDQAETLLLQLCRGAGPKGLAAMPVIKPFAKGFHARPLLNISREALLRYAHEHQLSWVEDEMNADIRLARTFVRRKVLPLLLSRWPAIGQTLARTANHCAEQEVLLSELITDELRECRGTQANTLSVRKLLSKTPAKQRLLIRTWLNEQAITLPNSKKLLTIQTTLLHSKSDRVPQVSWHEYEMRRFKDDIYLINRLSPILTQSYEWDLSQDLHISGLGQLRMIKKQGEGIHPQLRTLTVRFRQGGERIHLGKRGHKTLKNLMQEWAVAPWTRDRIPLLYDNERLIQVVGYCIDPAYAVKEREEGYEVMLS